MTKSYKMLLKVSTPDKVRVEATVYQLNNRQRALHLPYLKSVEQDSPEFAKNGKIKLVYGVEKHTLVIARITKYLESLFMKELEDANNDTKSESEDISRGNEKLN